MAIVRVNKQEHPFVQIDKFGINDERLSWKAKGLLVYLVSKPDDWKVWIKDLVKRAKDGEKAVYSGLEELESNGYISRRQERKTDGTFGPMEYVVHERPIDPQLQNGDTVKTQENQGISPQPQKGEADKKEPYPQNRHADNPHAENRHYTNNDLNNNDSTNNDMDGRLGDLASQSQSDQKDIIVKKEWQLFKNACEIHSINQVKTLDLYKVWRHSYSEAPVSIVLATLREMLDDRVTIKPGGWTEKEYKNMVGLFHHRMKAWREMAVAYDDIDYN